MAPKASPTASVRERARWNTLEQLFVWLHMHCFSLSTTTTNLRTVRSIENGFVFTLPQSSPAPSTEERSEKELFMLSLSSLLLFLSLFQWKFFLFSFFAGGAFSFTPFSVSSHTATHTHIYRRSNCRREKSRNLRSTLGLEAKKSPAERVVCVCVCVPHFGELT